MNQANLIKTAKRSCGWFTTPCEGELVYCTHPDNKCRDEGNCHVDDCPILSHMKELYKAQKSLG